MDKMKKFDERLKNVNSYDFLMTNVCKYFFSVIGVFFMALYIRDSIPMRIGTYWLIYYAVYLHVKPYLYTKNGEQKVSVYGIMRDIPINKKDYVKSRINHMIDYGKKVLVCCVVGRIVVMGAYEDYSFQNILDSLALIVTAIIATVFLSVDAIYSSMKE